MARLVAILSRLAPVGFTFAGFQLLNFFHSPYMLASFSTLTSFSSEIIIIMINADESLSVPELELLTELPIASAIFDILFDRHQSYDRVECDMIQIYPAVFTPLVRIFFTNRIRIVAVFLLLFFCSSAKIRWVCKSHTEQSLRKHKNSRVKSKYSLGTGEAKFPLGKEK